MSGKGTVLVTGAAKRVGRVIALEAARAGWDVGIHYNTSRDEAETLADEIRDLGQRAHTAQADFTDPRAIEHLIRHFRAEMGPLNALVNNAALFERDSNDPGGARHNAINVEAPCLLIEQFEQQLPPEQTGYIVNMLDSTASPSFFSAYTASKKGLREATLSLARKMAPRVRVNGVAPGPTWMNPRETKAHFDRMIAATPLQLEISPQAIAATVLFLMMNPVVTGEIIYIDGGLHLVNPEP